MNKVCKICETPFSSNSHRALYCSNKCKQRNKRNATEKSTTFDMLYTLDRNSQIVWVLDFFGKDLIDCVHALDEEQKELDREDALLEKEEKDYAAKLAHAKAYGVPADYDPDGFSG